VRTDPLESVATPKYGDVPKLAPISQAQQEQVVRNPRVFISYSHDSTEHSDRVLNLAWALRGNGIAVELDQFHNEKIVDWPRWCNEQTSHEHADFVVCVCTAEYRRRIEGKTLPEKGKGVHWEGSLLDDDLYDEKGNSRLIPILFSGEPESSIPRFLRGWTHCQMRDFALTDPGYEHLLRILTGQVKVEKNELGTIPDLATKWASFDPLPSVRRDSKEFLAPVIAFTLVVAALFWVKEQYPTALWAAFIIATFWLAIVGWNLILLINRRRREVALRDSAVRPGRNFEADYFRVGPYSGSQADQDRYSRPDKADTEIIAWVRAAGDPILYLSGLSGAGKSSLLNAALLPALAAGDPKVGIPSWQVLSIPEHGDCIAQLREAILTPGTIWKNPPDSRQEESIAELLRAACEYLEKKGRRLLLLCDQFEVVLIRHQSKDAAVIAFAQLLHDIAAGRRKVFPGLTILLTFRSDYDDLLKTLALPRWVEGKNGRRVAPFSRLVARNFLTDPRSGLEIAEGRLNQILDEAEAVTNTPGLIRPIVLNMLGKLLERHVGRDPARVPRGALLSHDVRRTVEADEVRAYARPVLLTLLREGLRVRQTVAETAKATGLAPQLVEGCHKKLLEWPLVRCVGESEDAAQARWEIAHDFVARLLAPILETPRRTSTERLRLLATPVLLFLTVVAMAGLWLGRENATRAELQNQHYIYTEVQRDKVLAKIVQNQKLGAPNLARITALLLRFHRPVELDLHSWPVLTNVDGLKGLTSLRSLNLGYCRALTSVKGIEQLTSLHYLDLAMCSSLPNLSDLHGLTSLRELRLASCDGLTDVNGLGKLSALEILIFRDNGNLRDINGLAGLNSLKQLELFGCKLVTDISVLIKLRSLQTLDLSFCENLRNADVLKEMNSLREVSLRKTSVRDAQLIAKLRAKGVNLVLDAEQQALMASPGPTPGLQDAVK
jgi:hypothetical protein